MTAQLSAVRIIDPPVPLPAGVVLPAIARGATGKGFREVRIPLWVDAEFRKLWTAAKLRFHQRGFSLRQHEGKWYLQQWLQGGPGAWTLTAVGQEKLDKLTAPAKPAPVMELPVEFVLPPLPDGLEDKLFEYQRQPARQLYRALCCGREEWGFPGAWDCSDLGTGKTYQALAAALATGLEVAVVCPKSVIAGWRRAFQHFGQQPRFILNYESLRGGRNEFIRRTSKDTKRYEWALDPDDVLIIWDECHHLKNPSLNRAMAMAAYRQGFRQIHVSGTIAAKPTNLLAAGAVVGLHRGDVASYTAFLKAHGCYQIGSSWDFDRRYGAKHLAAIHQVVFPKRGARVKISDLGDRFPETQILSEAVSTEETENIAALYEAAQNIVKALRDTGKSEAEILGAQRAAYMRARKASEMAKVPAIALMAAEEIDAGRSVAIFLNFTEARERMQALLKTKCAIFGGQSSQARDAAIAEFQADRSRVIVVMSAAGGTGVSLHDVNGDYARTALICPDNNAVTLGQCLGRVHRAGGMSRSRQVIVYAAGTVEEQICENVRGKLQSIKTINDGDLSPENQF